MKQALKLVTPKGGQYFIGLVENLPASSKWVVKEINDSEVSESWSELKSAVRARLQDHYGVLPISIKMGYDEATMTWPVTVTVAAKAVYQVWSYNLQTKEKSLYCTVEATPENLESQAIKVFHYLVEYYMSEPNHRIEYQSLWLKVTWDGGGVVFYATRP